MRKPSADLSDSEPAVPRKSLFPTAAGSDVLPLRFGAQIPVQGSQAIQIRLDQGAISCML